MDDPYQFGQIAAANALSDIYAMGGKPLFALNIVGFPREALPLDNLVDILKGGMDKAHEAGIHILGGHTIDDKEPKYGMVVTGEVAEDQLMRNSTAQAGDALVLTKPLGTGIIATAIKRGSAPDDVVTQAVETMTTLNRSAMEGAHEVGVHAMTDVTGYGLLGHLLEMCTASGLQAAVEFENLPLLPGTGDLASQGTPAAGGINIPDGTRRNLAHVKPSLTLAGPVSELQEIIAADAQTSGGLLIAVAPEVADRLVAALKERQTPAAGIIGVMTTAGPPQLTLRVPVP